MGAKFAPSLANPFMAEWEDRHVFSEFRPELKLYRRFIDDLLFVWEGSRESVEVFVEHLNHNTNNIVLDHVISLGFISDFHYEYKEIEGIFCKH